MCSIIVINNHYKHFPLVIAANRDEDIARQSSPVQFLDKDQFIIGGKDDVKGGSWLAANKESLFVSITNQKTVPKKDPRSRGLITLDALKSKSLKELISYVEELDPLLYNGFNLIFGNQEAIFIAHSYILHSMVIKELPKGVNLITSDMTFSGQTIQSNYIHRALDTKTNIPWLEYYKLLKSVLGSSQSGLKLKPKNKMGVLSGYCTRSSSILAFDKNSLARFKFHDRTVFKRRKPETDPFIPRYKDYIGLFKSNSSVVEEEVDKNEEDLNVNPFLKI